MHKNFRIIIYFLFLAFFIFSCDPAPENESTPETGDKDFTNLDSVLELLRGEFNFVGLSLAVVRDDRLVYAQSYGYSDMENSIPAAASDIYRIASVSKLITAVAIFKLVEEGIIALDEKVFGAGSIFGDDYGTPGTHVSDITVRHLLEYGSGFTDGGSGSTIAERISSRAAIDLPNPPGTIYDYKNIDYIILGRIIEKVTGFGYEKYLQDTVLLSCGITNMAIGTGERRSGEVKYYTPSGPLAISSLAMSDSAGGWTAAASDLARFFVRINRSQIKEDILSSTYTTYTQTPAAFGVSNLPPFQNSIWNYFGDMAGTRAVMSRLDDRTGFVLLVNTSLTGNDNYGFYVQQARIGIALRKIIVWPSHDLFEE